MKNNRSRYSKTRFFAISVALLLVMSVLLFIGTTFGKYCKEVDCSAAWDINLTTHETW